MILRARHHRPSATHGWLMLAVIILGLVLFAAALWPLALLWLFAWAARMASPRNRRR